MPTTRHPLINQMARTTRIHPDPAALVRRASVFSAVVASVDRTALLVVHAQRSVLYYLISDSNADAHVEEFGELAASTAHAPHALRAPSARTGFLHVEGEWGDHQPARPLPQSSADDHVVVGGIVEGDDA